MITIKTKEIRSELISSEGLKVLSSREVAEMMELQHKHLLQKVDGIDKDLLSRKIGSAKYWTGSTYKDASGKSNREYLITKRGCEFLANKTTGTKGNLFTDKYMDRFAEMEKELITNADNTRLLAEIGGQITTLVNDIVSTKIEEVEKKCSEYYKLNSATKNYIGKYIKDRLGILKANEEYEQVKLRVFLLLGATKWEDIDFQKFKESIGLIDESIRIIKMERPYEQQRFLI